MESPPRTRLGERAEEGELPGRGRARGSRELIVWILRQREASILLAAIVLTVVFQALSSQFLSSANVLVIMQLMAQIAIVAVAEAMLMICGEIDLSVGQAYALAPFIMYFAYEAGVPLLLGVVLGVLVGLVIGLVNGLVTVSLAVPSFITTLGTLFIINGTTLTTSHGFPILTPSGGHLFNTVMGAGKISPFVWALVVAAALHVVLTRTAFGLHTIATGSNRIGAKELGIAVGRVKVVSFMIVAGLGALLGIIEAVRITSADPLAGGTELMFQGIAAAVIGGTSLFGGSGSVIGAFLGSFVIAALSDGLTLLGISAFTYDIILGAAILAVMILNVRAAATQRSNGA